MSSGKAFNFRCPICRKPVRRDCDTFPFCSERCKTIDLGRWAAGDYHIEGEPAEFGENSGNEGE